MIQKTFTVIEALTKRISLKTTVKDISEDTNISNSAVHRILQALVEEDVVKYVPGIGYTLTSKLLTLGLSVVTQNGLLEYAIPVMRSIVAQTKETVSLNILSGYERLCIYRVEGDYPVAILVKLGDKGPLFRGAAGKVIAAGLTQQEINSNLKAYVVKGLVQENEIDHILGEIELVREQGYAVSIGELIQNSGSIAVPIVDFAGFIQTSLSISALADRLEQQEIRQQYINLLKDSAQQLQYKFA